MSTLLNNSPHVTNMTPLRLVDQTSGTDVSSRIWFDSFAQTTMPVTATHTIQLTQDQALVMSQITRLWCDGSGMMWLSI